MAGSASQQSWLQLITTLVSGPAEAGMPQVFRQATWMRCCQESVRVTMLFTFGWAARFDASFALGRAASTSPKIPECVKVSPINHFFSPSLLISVCVYCFVGRFGLDLLGAGLHLCAVACGDAAPESGKVREGSKGGRSASARLGQNIRHPCPPR